MPLLKFLFQVGDAVAFADQKHEKVIDQIRGLVYHTFIVPFHGLDDGLDGTKNGYAVETYSRLADELSIPVIASGGAGSVGDIEEVLTKGRADAALAASIFHYGEISIPDLKRTLRSHGVNVRI